MTSRARIGGSGIVDYTGDPGKFSGRTLVAGIPFEDDAQSRRFLGWSKGGHWLLPDTDNPTCVDW